jgi:hypothetical protein
MSRKTSTKSASGSPATATIGFEATAMRDGANLPRAAILRSLSEARDNRWLAADSRSEAQTAEGNRSNNMDAFPGQLFYSTQIPVCLWFLGKNNTLDSANDARLFDGETELSLVA